MTPLTRVEIVASPTIDTSAYAANELVTPLMALANPYRFSRAQVALDAIVIRDLDAQNAALDFVFFHTLPTGTTFTLNAALTLADADMPFVAGHASVLTTHYRAFAASSIATRTGIDLPFIKPISGSPTIWCVAMTAAATTPTYGANGLSFSFFFKQGAMG